MAAKNILLLHGAIGAKDQLLPLAHELEGSYKVHFLNFSGHGGSDFTGSFSIAKFADEVLEYLQKNKLEKVAVFGYSMGGYVALYLASKHPGRIESIFTLATKMEWTPDISAKESRMLNVDALKEKVPAFAEILKQRHAPNTLEEVFQKTADMLFEMGQNPSLTPEILKQINCPVCIAIGEKDQMVSMEESIQASLLLTNSTLLTLPETPHPIEKVDIPKLASEIKAFI